MAQLNWTYNLCMLIKFNCIALDSMPKYFYSTGSPSSSTISMITSEGLMTSMESVISL